MEILSSHAIGQFQLTCKEARLSLVDLPFLKTGDCVFHDLCAMAEVRLRFGRGAYTFLKPSYLPFLDKEAGYVTALIHSPQFCATRPDPDTCLETPKGKTSETRARLFTFFRDAGGSTGRLKAPFDFFTGDISVNRWTELHQKCIKADVNTSCLETRPLLCGSTNSYRFKHQSRKSIVYTQTLHGLSCAPLTVFSRAYSRKHNNDSAVPLYKSKSAYYDLLEVSPRATQTQIKTAYYKQSFIYHPDKNAGSVEATFRFSQINEAYNVLGNKALRKKYDRGVLSQGDLQGSGRPTGESAASSAGHQARARHSPSAGVDQQSIFDFDAFIRAHYGEQLQREKELRQRREEILRKQKEKYEDVKLGRMKEVTVGILLVMAMTIVLSLRSNN